MQDGSRDTALLRPVPRAAASTHRKPLGALSQGANCFGPGFQKQCPRCNVENKGVAGGQGSAQEKVAVSVESGLGLAGDDWIQVTLEGQRFRYHLGSLHPWQSAKAYVLVYF